MGTSKFPAPGCVWRLRGFRLVVLMSKRRSGHGRAATTSSAATLPTPARQKRCRKEFAAKEGGQSICWDVGNAGQMVSKDLGEGYRRRERRRRKAGIEDQTVEHCHAASKVLQSSVPFRRGR